MKPAPNKGVDTAALSQAARRSHRLVLTTFAETGRPPVAAELDALLELTEQDLVALDDAGEIRAAYPFSTAATRHRVAIAGGPIVHAMCAVDALGVSAMLGTPVTITATEPGTDHTIAIDVDGEQSDWSPDTAVVFAGRMNGACGTASADRTCGFINFFTTEAAARTWSADHTNITGTILARAEALAHGIIVFGGLLAR